MPFSVFDMFRVGICPSSSHTVGPMRAGREFIRQLKSKGVLEKTDKVKIRLLGSLAATGKGHATDEAVLLGLMFQDPATVELSMIPGWMEDIQKHKRLNLSMEKEIPFDMEKDLLFFPNEIDPYHTNAIDFEAFDKDGNSLHKERIFSPGGGFIETEEEVARNDHSHRYSRQKVKNPVPNPFEDAADLLRMCKEKGLTIAELLLENERENRSQEEIDAELDKVADVMHQCIERGIKAGGVLPGRLAIPKRAAKLLKEIRDSGLSIEEDPLQILDWLNLWGFAVAEENASGGRVITAPTNGAAGVIPAVLEYYKTFVKGADQKGVRDFLLTAGAVGMIYKKNASISGAEVGCQGEIGVACSMAAAGLTAAQGGTLEQIENAAEIGMEHFLGLTCDPVLGQVQIPCIERNAIAAVKAVNASRMALRGNGSHYVSLDQVIETMLRTGRDMSRKYKETSLGGLAVSIVEC